VYPRCTIQGAYKLSDTYDIYIRVCKYTHIHIYQQDGAHHIGIKRSGSTWMNTCQADGLVVQRTQTTPSAPGHPGHQTWQCVISSCGVSSRTVFTSHPFQRHYQNYDSESTPQSGTSRKICSRRFGGNGSNAWISAVSHEGRTSNSYMMYFCSVFVTIWFCKIQR